MNTLLLALLAGCYVETAYTHKDLKGTLKIPKEAATIQLIDQDNNQWEVTDPRAIGPVYLGVFASVQEGLFDYPHPEMGPVLDANRPGDTYPYGGTTVGRFDYGCYEQLKCKIVTGRYKDYDDVLGFFKDEVRQPVLNPWGEEVTDGIEMRERCYETQFRTSDREMLFIGEDRLNFKEEGDYYVADVEILHTAFEEGVAVWGWVDMPSRTFDFNTCNPAFGDLINYYDENFTTGTNQINVLNEPGTYIDEGDWVVLEPAIIDDPSKAFEIVMEYRHDG